MLTYTLNPLHNTLVLYSMIVSRQEVLARGRLLPG